MLPRLVVPVVVLKELPMFQVLPNKTPQNTTAIMKYVSICLRFNKKKQIKLIPNTQPTCGLELKANTIDPTKTNMRGAVIFSL